MMAKHGNAITLLSDEISVVLTTFAKGGINIPIRQYETWYMYFIFFSIGWHLFCKHFSLQHLPLLLRSIELVSYMTLPGVDVRCAIWLLSSGNVIYYKLAFKSFQHFDFARFLSDFLSKSQRLPLSSAFLAKWHMCFNLNLNSRQNQKLRQFISLLMK